jgi:trimethylamine--corrinoid protein Co-methyltransferase
MAEVTFSILTEQERKRIIDEAYRLVAEVGVRVESDSLGATLRSAGAAVDAASGCTRIPREMAVEYLRRVPAVYPCQTIDGRTIHAGGGDQRYVSLVLDPVIVDYDEGPRAPRLADVAKHAKIGDALPLVNTIYRMDQGVSDVPIEKVNAATLFEFLSNTTQHVTCNPADMNSARLWIEMVEVILGGDDFRSRPIASFGSHVTSPFRLGAHECELMEFLASRWILMSVGSCPMAGATSPFTLAGTLLLSLAETIFQMVVGQVLQPGLPMIGGSTVFAFNMQAGDVTAGGIETSLMDAAYAELIHELGMPVSGCIGFADSPALDVQAGVEAFAASLAMTLARVDSLNGLGTIGNAAGVSAEKIVIDHDLIEAADRFRRGVTVDDVTLAFDVISQVGPGGDFMSHEHTLGQLRTGEHYYGGSFGRGGPDHFSKPMIERAHERVRDILANHTPAVSDKTREELARVARKHGAAV